MTLAFGFSQGQWSVVYLLVVVACAVLIVPAG